MRHIPSSNRPSAALAALALALVAVLLAACGGSSASTSANGSTASASASASAGATSTPPGGPPAKARGARLLAFRECLSKNGINLPKRPPGERGLGRGGFLGSLARELPKGITRAQYEAALKKCGAPGRPLHPFQSQAAKTSLAKFAACMRQNGVKLPEPNTSGSGPIFNTKGLDIGGPTFRTAEVKCAADLRQAYPSLHGRTRTG